MTNGIYLQEDLQQAVYSYQFNVNYCREDNTYQIVYALASSKNCGVLLLIEKLLEKEENKPIQKRLKNYFIAKRLISNFYETKISITSSQVKEAFSFVSKIIKISENLMNSPSGSNPLLLIHAKRLTDLIDSYEKTSEPSLNKITEKFEEFALHYFQYRFYELIKSL
jgi:hypothetical protein